MMMAGMTSTNPANAFQEVCGDYERCYTAVVQVIIGNPDLKANHNITQIVEVVQDHEKYPKLLAIIKRVMGADPSSPQKVRATGWLLVSMHVYVLASLVNCAVLITGWLYIGVPGVRMFVFMSCANTLHISIIEQCVWQADSSSLPF